MTSDFPTQRRTSKEAIERAMIPPQDEVDQEILNALGEGRPVRMEDAFPDHPGPAPEDEIDELGIARPKAVQPTEIVQRPRRAIRMGGDAPPPTPDEGAGPAARLRAAESHAPAYAREFQLRILHRLLMRNLPLDIIASQLQVSVPQVILLRKELQKRLIHEAQTINRYEIAGKTLAFYDEVQGMAMRMADDKDLKPYTKLQAMQTALSAMNDRQRFLTASGFWGSAPFTPKDIVEDESSRAVGKLHQLIEMVMDDDGSHQIDKEAFEETERQLKRDDDMDLI